MLKAVKILMTEDGQMMAKPCDATEADMEGAQPFASMEEVMAAVPGMMEQSAGMEKKDKAPMMEGEAEFMAGFDKSRGGGSGY